MKETPRKLLIYLTGKSIALVAVIHADEELDDDEVADRIRAELYETQSWHRFSNIVVHPKAVAAIEVETYYTAESTDQRR